MMNGSNWCLFCANWLAGVLFGGLLLVPMERVAPGTLAKMVIFYGIFMTLTILLLSCTKAGMSERLRIKFEITSFGLMIGIFLITTP